MIKTPINTAKYKYTYIKKDIIIYSNIIDEELTQPNFKIKATSDNILNKFLDADVLKFIINNKDILAIILVGSRGLNIQDRTSDYDLQIITNDDVIIDGRDFCYLQYKNMYKLHFYYRPYADYVNYTKQTLTGRPVLALNGFNQITTQNILYVKNKEILNNIIEQLPQIQVDANLLIYKHLETTLITPCVENNLFIKTKLLYYLCIISHLISKTPFNKKRLWELKNIKEKEITAQCKKYCIKQLKFLKNYYREPE